MYTVIPTYNPPHFSEINQGESCYIYKLCVLSAVGFEGYVWRRISAGCM